MKKIWFFFVLTLVFVFSTTTYAQKDKGLKPKTDEEIASAFCHTWRLTGIEELGTRLPPPLKVDFNGLVLKNDGTCIKTSGGEEIPGIWEYRPKLQVLLIQDQGKDRATVYMITKITETEFLYKTKIAGYYTYMVFTRVE